MEARSASTVKDISYCYIRDKIWLKHMRNGLCDLRFSQLCWWRFQSSITWCCVKWYLVTEGSEERAAFIFRLDQEEYGLHSEAAKPTETITNYQSTQCNNPYNYNLQLKYKFITHCSYINGSHASYFIVIVPQKEVSWTNTRLHISLKLLTLHPSAPDYICLSFCPHTYINWYGYPLVTNASGWFSRPAGLKGTQKQ